MISRYTEFTNYIYLLFLQIICSTYACISSRGSYKEHIHTYIHNWPLQPFSQDYGLASFHITFMNFHYKSLCRVSDYSSLFVDI